MGRRLRPRQIHSLGGHADVQPGGVAEDTAWTVCRSLGISPGLIGRGDFAVGTASECIKFSGRVIVSIAPALLRGTDVVLLSSALDALGQEHASQARSSPSATASGMRTFPGSCTIGRP